MKYRYIYYIRTNNLCHGLAIVSGTYNSLSEARADLWQYVEKYGCCDIIKRRLYK